MLASLKMGLNLSISQDWLSVGALDELYDHVHIVDVDLATLYCSLECYLSSAWVFVVIVHMGNGVTGWDCALCVEGNIAPSCLEAPCKELSSTLHCFVHHSVSGQTTYSQRVASMAQSFIR